jgi:predicted DNA-binding protein (MmcQ/YjbR family)
MMNIDTIREFCLSFPEVTEKLQWGETLCFKVGGRIFAMLSLELDSEVRLTFKCRGDEFLELLESEGVRRAPYLGRYGWAALERLDSLPDQQIRRLVASSYQIIAGHAKRPKLGRRVRRKSTR